MLRQLLLGHGRSVAASLIVSAIVASQAPAPALAQSAGRLGIALETASASWTAPSSGRLAMRVSATNLDTSGLTGASVWIGLPRGIQDLRILAPTGWSCR